MRRFGPSIVLALLAWTLVGCTSGGGTVSCSFDDPAQLAGSPWPKFRHDLQNTGAVENDNVATNDGQLRWVFPAPSDPPKGPFAASPVLNGVATDPSSTTRLYIGSTDGGMYAINVSDGTQDSGFDFHLALPITSTALVGLRSTGDAIFFGSGDGRLIALDATATAQPTNWPTITGSFASASPTLNTTDGTVYIGDLNGLLLGVCPNGIARFGVSTVGVQSSAAIGTDDVVYFGADDGQLRALRVDGPQMWAFSATAPILSAPVVEITGGATTAIYVADRNGFVFKVDANGRPVAGFDFSGQNGGPVGPISSSPALAANHLYFGSDDGNLYAIRTDTAKIDWSFASGGAIVSSPAVATSTGAPPVVVVGSADGNVYFLQDNGDSATLLQTFTIPDGGTSRVIRSSPAIGSDGTVYVGADDGRVYAIGSAP